MNTKEKQKQKTKGHNKEGECDACGGVCKWNPPKWLLGILLMSLILGCSSEGTKVEAHPTAGQAASQYLRTYCGKLNDCFPSQFGAVYTSVDDCVTTGVSKLADPNGREACSQTQVDTCTKDTAMMTCPADVGQATLPASCNGC